MQADTARQWLLDRLEAGEAGADMLKADAQQAGHAGIAVLRAKCSPGIESIGPEPIKGWVWRNPVKGDRAENV